MQLMKAYNLYLVTGIAVWPGGVTVTRLAASWQERSPVPPWTHFTGQSMGVGATGTLASHWVTYFWQGTIWRTGTLYTTRSQLEWSFGNFDEMFYCFFAVLLFRVSHLQKSNKRENLVFFITMKSPRTTLCCHLLITRLYLHIEPVHL